MRSAVRGKRRQVKVRAASEAEWERWVAAAKRRAWSVNTLIRQCVNREIQRELDDLEKESEGYQASVLGSA